MIRALWWKPLSYLTFRNLKFRRDVRGLFSGSSTKNDRHVTRALRKCSKMAVTEKGHGYFPLYFPLWQFWRSRLICDQLDPRMPKWPNWKGKTNWAIFALSARVLSLSRPFWAILATSVHFCTDYFKNGLFPDNNKSVFLFCSDFWKPKRIRMKSNSDI